MENKIYTVMDIDGDRIYVFESFKNHEDAEIYKQLIINNLEKNGMNVKPNQVKIVKIPLPSISWEQGIKKVKEDLELDEYLCYSKPISQGEF